MFCKSRVCGLVNLGVKLKGPTWISNLYQSQQNFHCESPASQEGYQYQNVHSKNKQIAKAFYEFDHFVSQILKWDVQQTYLYLKNVEALQKVKEGFKLPNQFENIDEYIQAFKELILTEKRAKVLSEMLDRLRGEYGLKFESIPIVIKYNQKKMMKNSDKKQNNQTKQNITNNENNFNSRSNQNTTIQLQLQEMPENLPKKYDLGILSCQKINNESLSDNSNQKIFAIIKDVVPDFEEKDGEEFLEQNNSIGIKLKVLISESQFSQNNDLFDLSKRVFFTSIDTLVPEFREIKALLNVEQLDKKILERILTNEYSENFYQLDIDKACLPKKMVNSFKQIYNDKQLQVIAATDNLKKKVLLVQGPPGTGKTATILAIIASHLRTTKIGPNDQFNYQEDKSEENQSEKLQLPNNQSLNSSLNQSVSKIVTQFQNYLQYQVQKFGFKNKDEEKKFYETKNLKQVRVLVCAQSNAAADVIAERLYKKGIINCMGEIQSVNVVRFGNLEAVDPKISHLHVDNIAEKRLEMNGSLYPEIKQQIKQVREELESLRKSYKSIDLGEDTRELNPKLKTKLLQLLNKLIRDKFVQLKELESQARQTLKDEKMRIFEECEVVVCTLSVCGGDLKEFVRTKNQRVQGNDLKFDDLIVDEATQATEPSTLIPLYLIKPEASITLVGDPKQLPPTIISKAAEFGKLSQTLFERLQQQCCPVIMLQEQYRMHPEICRFPSNYFYGGELKSGGQIDECSRSVDYHKTLFGPTYFFDISSGKEQKSPVFSTFNKAEAATVLNLIKGLLYIYGQDFKKYVNEIAILSPYKAQIEELTEQFKKHLPKDILEMITICTVDSFQGKECDLVILSCVRAQTASIGFLQDVRRMNVALTRARCTLWIVANQRALNTNEAWKQLIQHMKQRNLFVTQKQLNQKLKSIKPTNKLKVQQL